MELKDQLIKLYETRAIRKAIRTLLQVVVAAIGTGGLNVVLGGLDPSVLGVIGVTLTTVFTAIQNGLEDSEVIPRFLPSPTPIEPHPPLVEP